MSAVRTARTRCAHGSHPKHIPVVILTTSQDEQDVLKSYNLYANCYMTKPVDVNQFITVVKSIEDFWLGIVVLPEGEKNKAV